MTPAPLPSTVRYWRLPALTIGLFLVLIATLVGLTRHYDQEEQQATLVSDVLWMEQNLHFHLERVESQLTLLAEDLFRGTHPSPQADARLRQILNPESALRRVYWLDAQGAVLGMSPPVDDATAGASPRPTHDAALLARSTGRPVYGPPLTFRDGAVGFEVHIPFFAEAGFRGTVVGFYDFGDLLAREIPWWFSERYRVRASAQDGREIASKSKVAPLASQLEYQIPFDPPGHGLRLQVTAYRGETRWIPILLMASMVVLAGIIIWSLLQLRRHVARRQATEQALRDAMAFRKAMEDSLITGLRARDLAGRITYVNPAFCRMIGYEAEELVGRAPPMPYWDPEDPPSLEERQQQILSGEITASGVERRLIRKNGDHIDALVLDAPLIDAEGRHTGWMGSVLDITEEKRMRDFARQQEERLQATARLVTMGEMASTLAHELNQPLAAISSYSAGCLNHLERADADPAELKGILAKLSKQAQRAGQIIKGIHDFVRRSEPKRELMDLNALLREAVALVEPDARKHLVRIETALTEGLPPVAADRGMVEQVLVNLIRNGMDAMRETPASQRQLQVTTRMAGDQVTIDVADRGCGIPPEAAQRLFQPFFTTKAEGMGMGLNICRSIAELHRGKLGFEPRSGGGTIFTFSLPAEAP